MATTLEIKTVIDNQQALKANDEMVEGIDNTNEAVEGVTASLDKMTGGAITAFKGIVSGTKKGILAMKSLKVAIAATGIGLLVIAVGSLVGYFANTQEGADKINQAFKVVGATVDVLVDRVSMFGKGLFLLFDGQYAEAARTMGDAFKGVANEMIREGAEALKLEKAFQALEKRQIKFIVTQQELRTKIEAARLAAEEGATALIKQEAIEKAIQLENELADEKIAIATEEVRIMTARIKLGQTMNDEERSLSEATAALSAVEAERDTRLKELAGRQRALNAELARANELASITNQLEADRKALEDFTPTSRGFADMGGKTEEEIKIEQNQFMLDTLAASNAEFDADQSKKKEDELARTEAIEKAKINVISKSFAIATQLAGDNAEASKGIAAAQALFNTYQAINGTLAAFSTVPIPGYAIASAVATGVFGLLQVQKILSTNPTSASGGGSIGGGGSINTSNPRDSGNIAPNVDFFNEGVGNDQNSRFSNVRAYVVSEEITDEGTLTQRLKDIQRAG